MINVLTTLNNNMSGAYRRVMVLHGPACLHFLSHLGFMV